MSTDDGRRRFLKASASAVAAAGFLEGPPNRLRAEPVAELADLKVVVWDERQPAQKKAYENFLGNQIAQHLQSQPGLSVRSVALDDPGQGLSDDVLDGCDVLVWWGHVRQAEVTPETGRKVLARVESGQLGLVVLHSAHWSTPFVEAMNARARLDASKALGNVGQGKVEVQEVSPPKRYSVPKRDDRPTPFSEVRKFPDGTVKVTLHMPYSCFPAYRADGKPSTVRLLKPDHPVVKGVPREFTVEQTEMYDEPFHVPEPDEVIFEESCAAGEWFRSGMVWKIGKGRVFYFRPGHETFPVFKQPIPLKIIANAVRWLGSKES